MQDIKGQSAGKYVFGPVPSRRLGFSLGVDVVPHKVCTYDCVYCQVGRTTLRSCERAEYVPFDTVVAQIQDVLDSGVSIDYVTISGSGEPTLYSRLGELIDTIKKMSVLPVAVITNGSLLHDPQVRQELMQADLVMPSLDAGDELVWQKINRPDSALAFGNMVEGLRSFSREYRGKLWLEVFFVEGLGDLDETVAELIPLLKSINPQRIQLNTVVRPPADSGVRPVSRETLARIAKQLGPSAQVIASFDKDQERSHTGESAGQIVDLVSRHPSTPGEISAALGFSQDEVDHALEQLLASGRVVVKEVDGRRYYDVVRGLE